MIQFNAGAVVVRVLADAAKFHATMAGVNSALVNNLRNFTTYAAGMSRALTTGLTLPVVLFGAISTRAFVEFDRNLTKSLAAAGGVSQQIRHQLEQSIFGISSRSTTSPAELADAYYYLISAGLSIAQSRVSLPIVERFAVAGFMPISRATDMLADVQFALNMVSNDAITHAQNLTRITDVIAMASIRSNATIEQLSLSLTNKAAAAMRLFNISLEEGVAALMVYAQQGTKAEIAGERLQIVIRDLQSVNIIARKEWEKYGLTVFNAAGQMLPLANIIGQLERRMHGMNDEQRRALLLALQFPSRSVHALLPLIGRSADLARFQAELTSEAGGFSGRVAELTLQSFGAQIRIFWNHVTIAAIEAGRAAIPALMGINRELQRMTAWWIALDPSIRRGLVLFFQLAALYGPLLLLSKIIFGLGIAIISAIFNPLSLVFSILVGGGILFALAFLVRNSETLHRIWLNLGDTLGNVFERIGGYFYNFNENFDIVMDYISNNWHLLLRDMAVAVGASLLYAIRQVWVLLVFLWEGISSNWHLILNSIGRALWTFLVNVSFNIGLIRNDIIAFFFNTMWEFLKLMGNIAYAVIHIFINVFTNLITLVRWFIADIANLFSDLFRNTLPRMFAAFAVRDFGLAGRHLAEWSDKVRRTLDTTMQRARRDMVDLIDPNIRFPFTINFMKPIRTLWQAFQREWDNFAPLFRGADWDFGDLQGWRRAWETAIRSLMQGGVFQDFIRMLGGFASPALGLISSVPSNRRMTMAELQAMRIASSIGMGMSHGGGGLGATSGMMRSSDASQIAAIIGNSTAGYAGATMAMLADFSTVARSIPAAMGPMAAILGSTMSGTQFESISTRRFAIDGPFGLANMPSRTVSVRDNETHRRLDSIIAGNNDRRPVVGR